MESNNAERRRPLRGANEAVGARIEAAIEAGREKGENDEACEAVESGKRVKIVALLVRRRKVRHAILSAPAPLDVRTTVSEMGS
jgi:hypothetical protein